MVIYPNEAWPGDLEIQNLDGSIDAGTGLPYIAKGTGPGSTPSYEVQYNRREQRLNGILANCRQGMVVWEGGLTIGVYPIEFTLGGYAMVFDGATGIAVPDNAFKAVYLDSAAELKVAEVFPTDNTTYLPLATVQTTGSHVIIRDKRTWAIFRVPAAGGGSSTDRRILTAHRATIAAEQSALKMLEFDPRENLVIEEVQVFCGECVESAAVDVREAGVSVLTAPAAPVSGTLIKPAIADANVSAANNLTVHVTTDGTGFVSDLSVTLLLRTA